jgi:hypothetical protein
VRLGLLDADRIADLAVANRQGRLADDGLSGELLAAMRETGFDAFRRPGMLDSNCPPQTRARPTDGCSPSPAAHCDRSGSLVDQCADVDEHPLVSGRRLGRCQVHALDESVD